MRADLRVICHHVAVLLLTLSLSSCGGGTSTAGVGGSGIGGTGITRVAGNVTQVVSFAPTREHWFANLLDWLSTPASAQSSQLGGIQVSGGGQNTLTDGSGRFNLEGVTPSSNFVLSFTPQGGDTLALPIGPVSVGSQVQVNNIVLNSGQGSASASDVEVEEDDDGDGDSADDDEVDGETEDADSTDNDAEEKDGEDTEVDDDSLDD